ncbi:MAG: class I SAM-dependent methyltransferase [Sedimentisphaerales bacterium]|nr:class I SAM-dependent methyltransferase [Sedimentisphaerales bacterium]
MNTEKRDFNKEAAAWDENPVRVKLAQDVANAIKKQIELIPDMDVMDFGCGTGLLTLQIQPSVHSITGIDNSLSMLDILNSKISKLNLCNTNSLFVDLDKGDILKGKYDLVVSNMTLHHIKELDSLLNQFYNILKPDGYLCLCDLDLEEGKFHNDNTGVFHFGFSREELRENYINAGFVNITDITAAEITKPTVDGEMKTFTVFLMAGRKK